MKYGVLGTGNVARTIADKLIELGHEVMMGSRSDDNPAAVLWAAQNGGRASHGTFADAATFGERVFCCVQGIHALEALQAAGEGNLAGKILIDLSNPFLHKEGNTSLDPQYSGWNSLGEEVQRMLPHTKVVKALNYFRLRPDDPTGNIARSYNGLLLWQRPGSQTNRSCIAARFRLDGHYGFGRHFPFALYRDARCVLACCIWFVRSHGLGIQVD